MQRKLGNAKSKRRENRLPLATAWSPNVHLADNSDQARTKSRKRFKESKGTKQASKLEKVKAQRWGRKGRRLHKKMVVRL